VKKFLLLSILPLVIIFVLFELSLRLAGYESPLMDPYASFVEHRPLFELKDCMLTTDPGRTAFFHETSFQADKPSGHVRFFLFGGSAAYGYKLERAVDENYGALLAGLLHERSPGTTFEAINCGGICYASYRLVGLVEECLRHSPDFIIVASGHNEFLEPRHYRELLTARKGSVSFMRLCRTAQLVQHLATAVRDKGQGPAPPEPTVLAPDRIDERYIVRDRNEFDQTRLHFVHNIRRIVDMCRKKKVPVLLCTLPSNLRDWPPFHTSAGDALPERMMTSQFGAITELMANGKHEQALTIAKDVLQLHPDAAAFYYLAGKCSDAVGNTKEALALYRLARDRDGFPHRVPSSFTSEIRKMSSEPGVILFDGDKLFAENSPDGIPGNNLFLDQCHPNAEGHKLLAAGLLDTMSAAGLVK